MKTRHGPFFGFAVLAITAMFALAGCDSPTQTRRPQGGSDVPATPTNVRAEAQSATSISISWSSVSGASGYQVYRAESSGGTYSYRDWTDSTSYTDNDLSSNTTYYYRVSATNAYGGSSQSDYTYATTLSGGGPGTPEAPASVMAMTQSATSINVSWSSVSDINYYAVYRATGSSSGSYTSIASTSDTSYTDNNLSPNTTYYYKVSAANSAGEGSQSTSYGSATTPNPGGGEETGVPAAPASVGATVQSASSIDVIWSYVPGASRYNVYRATGSNGAYYYVTYTSNTSYTDNNLSSSTTYYYRVSAENSYGEGLQSTSYGSATTLESGGKEEEKLATPANLRAVAQSSSSIEVSWDSVPDATQYYVYRASNSGGSYYYQGTTYDASYTDTGLSANTTYYYQVSAYNGTEESDRSDYVSATTFVGAPYSVTATAQSASSINVSWSFVSGATEYYIYRAESGSGTYASLTTTSNTSYTDTGLSANTAYNYKVSAYNSVGEGEQSSYEAFAMTFVDAPTGVTAVAQSSGSIAVSWDPVDGASGYYIYRSTSPDDNYAQANYQYTTSYTDNNCYAATSYYYKVSASNTSGESAQSTYASATTFPTPGTLNITVGFDLGNIIINGNSGDNTIRQTDSPQSLALRADGYDDVAWYVDGDSSAPVSGDTITLSARDYDVRNHSVTFTGYKNGTPYAQVIPFAVSN